MDILLLKLNRMMDLRLLLKDYIIATIWEKTARGARMGRWKGKFLSLLNCPMKNKN